MCVLGLGWGRPILHRYANEDVSLGSWFIGLEVEHIDERSMCCATHPGMSTDSIESYICIKKSIEYVNGAVYILVQFSLIVHIIDIDCERMTQAGNVCVASFDWKCSGICNSVERMKDVHNSCGEGTGAVWNLDL